MTRCLVVALACLVVLLVPSHAAAVDLTLSPTTIEIDAAAGDTVTQNLRVSSTGALALEFVHQDVGYRGVDYEQVLIPDDAEETTSFSTRGWFSIEGERISLRPDRQQRIALRITVPEETPSGTYLGIAALQPLPDSRGQIQVSVAPAARVTVNVAGGNPPKAKVERFSLPRIVTDGPLEPTLVVDNVGDASFRASGTMTIDGRGTKRSIDLVDAQIVPGLPRRLHPLEPAPAPTPGAKQSKPEPYRIGPKHLVFGRYTVTSRIRIEPTGDTLVVERTIWVIPMWMRVVSGALVLVLAALVLVAARHVRAVRRSR